MQGAVWRHRISSAVRAVGLTALLLLTGKAGAAEPLDERVECFRQAMEHFLQRSIFSPDAPVDLGNGGFTLHDVKLRTNELAAAPIATIPTLDVLAFDCASFRSQGAPTALRFRASGISVAPAAHPLAKLLPGLPMDRPFDVDLDIAYAPGSKRLTVRQADVAFGGIGKLQLGFDATGPDLSSFRLTQGGLMMLGTSVAFGGRVHGLTMTLENHAGDRSLEALARGQGKSAANLRSEILAQLDRMAATKGKEAAVPLIHEVRAFVLDPRRLTVRLQPPGGSVDMASIAAAVDNVGEQIRLLRLTIEANR